MNFTISEEREIKKSVPINSEVLKKEYLIRFRKFVLLGGFNYLLNIFLVWLGVEIIGLYYLYSVGTAYFIITVANYFWNSVYIFKVRRNSVMLIKYITSLAVFYCLHVLFVLFFTEVLNVYYLLSVTISITAMFFIKFVVYHELVFRDT